MEEEKKNIKGQTIVKRATFKEILTMDDSKESKFTRSNINMTEFITTVIDSYDNRCKRKPDITFYLSFLLIKKFIWMDPPKLATR